MKASTFITAGGLAMLLALNDAAAFSPVRHRLMFFEYGKGLNRLLELDASGKVVWEHKPPSIAVIFEVLPNGNVLYADKRVVWKWDDHSFIKSLTTVRALD